MILGVALRKESVDRNIVRRNGKLILIIVALRKESVDRNGSLAGPSGPAFRRSP